MEPESRKLTEKEFDVAIEAAEKWPKGTNRNFWVTAKDPYFLRVEGLMEEQSPSQIVNVIRDKCAGLIY
jgi:hypothetical protein